MRTLQANEGKLSPARTKLALSGVLMLAIALIGNLLVIGAGIFSGNPSNQALFIFAGLCLASTVAAVILWRAARSLLQSNRQ